MAGVHGTVPNSIVVTGAKAAGSLEAAEDIVRQLASAELAMVLVFVSPFYDPSSFIKEISQQMPDTPVFGCTTAGEIAPHGWEEDSVVALGFAAEDFIVSACVLPDLSSFRIDGGISLCRELYREFARRTEHCDAAHGSFGLIFIDGMCQREEAVMSAIYASLEDVPVVGGSAGDRLQFERSWVFYDGNAYTNAAVLILIRTSLPFRLFKCDNFEPTSNKMVVTEADIECRVVKEINAEPAALEYSKAVGVDVTQLDAFAFAAHPVLVRVGGSFYARSIQRMDSDASLRFFCAVDEGMVLTVARARDPVESTREFLNKMKDEMGKVSIFLGFECLFRRLDVERRQLSRGMSDLYRLNNVIGFHTYGEQYRSVHINQTLTGVAIGTRAPR